MAGWVDLYKKRHPFRYRLARLSLKIEYAWAWLIDEPNHEGIGLRTGKPKKQIEDESS